MVDRANHRFDGLGGHLSTYASAAALYEVASTTSSTARTTVAAATRSSSGPRGPGHLRARLPRRTVAREQLESFRREVDGTPAVVSPSAPAAGVLEFPTVSHGLSPLNAVAQARINGTCCTTSSPTRAMPRSGASSVTGETDEPEPRPALDRGA